MAKHKNKSKEELLAEVKFAKGNEYMILGMQMQKMMDLMKLWDGYDWEPSEVKVFHEMTRDYLQARRENFITVDDVAEQIERLKGIGIDILVPDLLK